MDYTLNEILPQASEFYLEAKKKTYHLRPVTLADEAWIIETFGETYKEMLMGRHMHLVARAVYHQMTEEGKRDFPLTGVKIMNESGQTEETVIGGYLLFMALIKGSKEKTDILMAYRQTVGMSSPKVDPKKKVSRLQRWSRSIGLAFLT